MARVAVGETHKVGAVELRSLSMVRLLIYPRGPNPLPLEGIRSLGNLN